MLWLSPLTRAAYSQQAENYWQGATFASLGIPSRELDLTAWLQQQARWGDGSQVPAEMRRVLGQYLESQDVISLRRLLQEWPQYRYERVLELNSRQAFLLVHDRQGRLLLVVNLAPRQPAASLRLADRPTAAQTIEAFLETRAGWLEIGGSR